MSRFVSSLVQRGRPLRSASSSVRVSPVHPSCYGVLITMQLLRGGPACPADSMECDNGRTLNERQLVDATRRTAEHQERRRR